VRGARIYLFPQIFVCIAIALAAWVPSTSMGRRGWAAALLSLLASASAFVRQRAPPPPRAVAYAEGRAGPRNAGIAVVAGLAVLNVALATADAETKRIAQDPLGLCTPLSYDAARAGKEGLDSRGEPCMPAADFARRLFAR
jgi:hypothetical protein